MTKKTFKNNTEVVGKAYEFDVTSAPTGGPQNRFSRASRICLVVDTEGKVLKESNYLDCLYFCATNTEKALRVEFLQSKIPSFYDRLRDSEELANQLLSGNVVYIKKNSGTISESLISENDVLEKISIPNDVLNGPVNSSSVDSVASSIEKNNPNCILIILDGENPDDEISSKMDQVCNSIPNNQVRPLYQNDQIPELPMLEDFGFPEEENESKDEDKTEYTNNHQGDKPTTRDMTEESSEQVVAPTQEVETSASEDSRSSSKETSDAVGDQYSEPTESSANPLNVDSSVFLNRDTDNIPVAVTGNDSSWLGRGVG